MSIFFMTSFSIRHFELCCTTVSICMTASSRCSYYHPPYMDNVQVARHMHLLATWVCLCRTYACTCMYVCMYVHGFSCHPCISPGPLHGKDYQGKMNVVSVGLHTYLILEKFSEGPESRQILKMSTAMPYGLLILSRAEHTSDMISPVHKGRVS